MPGRDEQSDVSRDGSDRRSRGSYLRETPYGKPETHKGGEYASESGEKDEFKNPNQGG